MKTSLWLKKSYAEKYARDYSFSLKDIKSFIKKLEISGKDIVMDFGCGGGAFVRQAAGKAFLAVGLDINSAQIRAARQNNSGIGNVRFIKSDFLSFENLPVFNKGFARKSLHHLNDAQKKIFFRRAARLMPRGSLFLIEDGIFFSFSRKQLGKNWERLMRDCRIYYGKDWERKKDDVIYCFRREYPTGLSQWKSALSEGGFRIAEVRKYSSFYGYILARKER